MKDYVIGAFALLFTASVPAAWHAGDVNPMLSCWLEQERVRTVVQGLELIGNRNADDRLVLESSAQR